jgi:hypothetical protein
MHDEWDDLGSQIFVQVHDVDRYLHRVVKIFVKDKHDKEGFGIVVGVQNHKSLDIVWLLTRDQALKSARSPGTSKLAREQLESVSLAKHELLFTDWRDRISLQ